MRDTRNAKNDARTGTRLVSGCGLWIADCGFSTSGPGGANPGGGPGSYAWLLTVAIAVFGLALPALAQSVAELEKRVRQDASVEARQALAEAYLRDCELEKSLALWREILRAQPGHKRAKLVVDKLTAQALDLDTQLATIGKLIDKGVSAGTKELLDAASERAATNDQKACILQLRGLLAISEFAPCVRRIPPWKMFEDLRIPHDEAGSATPESQAGARSHLAGAMTIAPNSVWAARAAILLAWLDALDLRLEAAARLLRQVADNDKLADKEVRQIARFYLTVMETGGLTRLERASAFKDLLDKTTAPAARRMLFEQLADLSAGAEQTPASVEYLGLLLKASTSYEQAADVLGRLTGAVGDCQDPDVLDAALAVLKRYEPAEPALADKVRLLTVEAVLARACVENNPTVMSAMVARAHKLLDAAEKEGSYAGAARAGELRGQCYLVEAQKLIATQGPIPALPLLVKAREHYLKVLPLRPAEALGRLATIASLLEHVKEYEMAVALYREVTRRYPHLPQGRDAMLKVAELHDKALRDPIAALAAYAEYSARYPAELPLRQRDLGARLRRLGYANLLDFQKRMGLKPDGIPGPKTLAKLEAVERAFGEIRAERTGGEMVLKGEFVYPTVFRIARDLQEAGRAREAIAAYRMFVNLFPTKSLAHLAAMNIARLLRDNLLFEEAIAAYMEVIEDYPKGSQASLAYIEMASCLENLGRWQEAREQYELYAKKFPRYKHVGLCRQRMEMLDEIRQYQEFVTENPEKTKTAEAQYQLAVILYKKFRNYTKAAVEFRKVAEKYPKHVRAVDGLYTAGTALLKAENFPAARAAFGRAIKGYPDSRLADDAQFWIAHTYEYAARALGKLDRARIVLKRRSLAERERLTADLELRRSYWPEAKAKPDETRELWGGDVLGVLTSGSTRDRVNADLFRAIEAYRKVVDEFKAGDMAGEALLRIGTIHIQYLKDPAKGIKAYQELLARYGATPEAVDALYEVGAYYLKEGNHDEAIKAYQQFVYNYPKEARVADAMLAVARCHLEKKAWDKALDAYESYLAKFPRGKDADFAKAQVAWIRMYHY